MFGKKKEDKEPKPENFGYEYEFGIRGSKDRAFYCKNMNSLEAAEEGRQKILATFRKAIVDNKFTEVDEDLGVNGKDLTWFWVGEARKFRTT